LLCGVLAQKQKVNLLRVSLLRGISVQKKVIFCAAFLRTKKKLIFCAVFLRKKGNLMCGIPAQFLRMF
jgi:hypothetical protein